jgi:hypothetical protein
MFNLESFAQHVGRNVLKLLPLLHLLQMDPNSVLLVELNSMAQSFVPIVERLHLLHLGHLLNHRALLNPKLLNLLLRLLY